jgi:very-short-patch-repair endonuclease
MTDCSSPIFKGRKWGRLGGGRKEKHIKKTKRSTPKSMHRAGELHREQTHAEAKLWVVLRAHRAKGVHFRRQHAIGPYITDFCAPRQKLVIELDGSKHLDQEEYDAERTAFLESKGCRVLRFWNSDIMNNINGVMGVILVFISFLRFLPLTFVPSGKVDFQIGARGNPRK